MTAVAASVARAAAVIVGSLATVSVTGADSRAQALMPLYQRVHEIALPGGAGGDAVSIDPASRRLYVTRADHIDVIDIDHDRIVGTITDTPGVHGFAIAHAANRGFASDGDTSQLSVIDLKTLTTVAHVNTGTGPGAVVFDPVRNEVYAFNSRGNSATIVDASRNRVLTTLALPGRPESAVVDPQAGRVYVDIVDRNLVLAIDAHTHAIAGLWQISPGIDPTSLAIDAVRHRLFVGCHNQRLLMVDADSGRVLATVPIGPSVDASVFDDQQRWVFNASGNGSLAIAAEGAADRLSVIQTLSTHRGARTLALDPVSGNLYLSLAERASDASTADNGRPAIEPDTFRVLVFARQAR